MPVKGNYSKENTMKTTTNQSVLFVAAHKVAKDLIGDSYRQCFSFALRQVHAWARKAPVKPTLASAIEKSVAEAVKDASNFLDVSYCTEYGEVLKAVYQHFSADSAETVFDVSAEYLERDISEWGVLQRLKQALVGHKGEILSVTFERRTRYWFVPVHNWYS